MAKKGFDQKEQLLAGAMMAGFAMLWQVNKQLTAHMESCTRGSQAVSRIGYGILVIVAAGLILSGINAYHGGANDTTQRTTMIEEKVKH